MKNTSRIKWLLLIHQIPPKPDYFRVKIWRRLQQVGAIAIKQSVYVLPPNEHAYEDFSWILKEITDGGGDASLSEAWFIGGLTDDQIVSLFQDARSADYDKLIEEVNAIRENLASGQTVKDVSTKIKTQIGRLQKRYDDIVAIDFFSTPARIAAENAISDILSRLKGVHGDIALPKSVKHFTGRVWVTRKDVFVDRIASAWLVTRFIDKKAEFKFIGTKTYTPGRDEVRFDMFEAEFTHQGNNCTFETLIQRFDIKDKALDRMGEIVHDIDLKDRKFQRSEADGLSLVFSGIAAAHAQDIERIEIGGKLLDDLYAYFKRRP